MKKLRYYLISGLLFWLPLGVTVLFIKVVVESLDNIVPAAYRPEQLFGFNIPGFGVIFVFIIILITGVLIANLLGKKLVELWEKLLNKIPGFRSIYNAIKQLSSSLLASSNDNFKKALLIEYPRKGLWTIAFQTGDYKGEVEEYIGEEIINIYVPTTPNPTSGFFIMLAKKDVKELDMSIDQAFKLIISTGIITPESKKIKIKKSK